MKTYELKSKEDLAVEVYMPLPNISPSMDYCFHAADWALCYPVRSKARAILNAAEGLAEATNTMIDWNKGVNPVNYFRFEFKDTESLRIFTCLIKDYL